MARMIPYMTPLAVALAAAGCEAQPATAEDVPPETIQTVDIDQHRWEHRVIVLFAPDRESESYDEMKSALEAQSGGVNDRDLVIYHLFSDTDGFRGESKIPPNAARSVASRYDVDPESFTYLLIGKDGGVKMRSESAVAVSDIFATIDAMPMRQREMLDQQSE